MLYSSASKLHGHWLDFIPYFLVSSMSTEITQLHIPKSILTTILKQFPEWIMPPFSIVTTNVLPKFLSGRNSTVESSLFLKMNLLALSAQILKNS